MKRAFVQHCRFLPKYTSRINGINIIPAILRSDKRIAVILNFSHVLYIG